MTLFLLCEQKAGLSRFVTMLIVESEVIYLENGIYLLPS